MAPVDLKHSLLHSLNLILRYLIPRRYPDCTVRLKLSTLSSAWRISISGPYLGSCPLFAQSSLIFVRFFNKTDYSGLETHILNSYTNSILQVIHYVLPIRQLSASHTTTNCPREHCLLCELGFVVRMLEVAQGTNCQASNFCKTVGVLAQCKYIPTLCTHLSN
jgi:hypothetical protein